MMTDKIRLATVWLGGCSGCHMSFLDLDERLIDLAEAVELVYSPIADIKKFPEDVDATLVDRRGSEVRMPTYFDEDLEHAQPRYQGGDPAVQRHLSILQTAMKQAGFRPLTTEWWHFDDEEFVNNPQPVIFAWELGIAIQ